MSTHEPTQPQGMLATFMCASGFGYPRSSECKLIEKPHTARLGDLGVINENHLGRNNLIEISSAVEVDSRPSRSSLPQH